jgi:hypothetical protein
MVNVNLDKSIPSNYQLVIPLLPSETTLGATDELTLNIFETVIPGLSLDIIETMWQGATIPYDSGKMTFEPWSFNFVVDSNFYNWKVLFNWITLINNNKDVHGGVPSEYAVDATLRITDNFLNEIMRLHFTNIWPNQLSEVTLTTREGEANLECNAAFAYDRYELREDTTV